MVFNKNECGFTLIELLIVIAIIGILASMVLTSLNSARDKGTDAAVKSNLKNIVSEAAIYYDDHGMAYSNMCTADQKVVDEMNSAKNFVSATQITGSFGDGDCKDSASTWAAWVNLKTSSTSAYCVDSTGAAKEIAVQNSSTANLQTCP